jgi:CRP/FNR family transcriptional regulator, cyclic AMP receptor protein
MFAKNAKVQRLASVPLFAQCSKRELGEIASVADELGLPAGRTLMREGDSGRELVVVLDGEVEVRRKGRRLSLSGDGNVFGEAALLTGAPRNATVTTTSPVTVLVITDRAFDRLLREVPTIQRKLLASLAERAAIND